MKQFKLLSHHYCSLYTLLAALSFTKSITRSSPSVFFSYIHFYASFHPHATFPFVFIFACYHQLHNHPFLFLSSTGADINAQTEETQETALTLACCGGFRDVADLLIKAGADLELGASTPLMEAAQEGHRDLVE